MSQILPPAEDEELVPISHRIPRRLLKELDEDAKTAGHTRSAVINHYLRWASAQYRTEQQQTKKAKK